MVSNFGLDFAISCLHFALFFIFLRVARLRYRLDALDFESTYVIYDCGAIWLFPGVVMAIYCRYSAKCIEFWANFAKFPHCMANINQSSPLKSFNPTGLRRIYIFVSFHVLFGTRKIFSQHSRLIVVSDKFEGRTQLLERWGGCHIKRAA